MADFTGKQIRNSYDRVVQFNSGSLTDGLGGALSASIHRLTVDTDLVVSGSIRAEELIVTRTTSSILNQSGSNNFGDSLDDNQTMTGSVSISGSLSLNGSPFSGVSSSLATLSGSFEVIEGKTLVSSSNQIASNISGSFTIASGGLATRIASQESFSSSLDATYATDAQLATAVAGLNLKTGSYAITGSNIFDAQQSISASLNVSQSVSLGERIRIGSNHWDTTYSKVHDKSERSEIWFEQNRNSADGGDLVFFRSRGTPGAETVPQVGDNIFQISGRPFISGASAIRSGSGLLISDWSGVATIKSTVRQISSGSAGGDLEFLTAPSGYYNTKTRLTIDQEGAIRASGSIQADEGFTSSGTSSFNHITASSMQAGKVYGNEAYNNYLSFHNSASLFKVQSKTYIKFDGSNAQREVTVNEGTNDIDFVVKGNNGVGNGNPLVHTDSATHKIGMHGVGTPTAGLHIADDLWVSGSNGHITASGNISASGALIANNVTASVVQAAVYRSTGTGETVINSANNLVLSSSNAVVVSNVPLRLNTFTNAQTGSVTFANGDMIYNSSRHKFLGYANGAFVELH